MPLGPGGLDSQGVYIFGEADLEAFASDLLNLLGNSVSAQLVADRLRLTSAETRLTTAETLMTKRIIPSAATNGSVSASGVVTSTAQSIVRVRDAFPPGYTVFEIVYDVTMSGASGPQIRLAANASDAITGYDRESNAQVAAANVPAQGLNGSEIALSPINVAGARHFGRFLITDANLAGPTYLDGNTAVAVPSGMTASTGRANSGGMHRTATAYNSFSLFGTAGNITVNRLTVHGVS